MKCHQGGRLVHYICASRMIEAVLVQNNQEGIWKESRPPEGRPEDSSIYIYIFIYIYVLDVPMGAKAPIFTRSLHSFRSFRWGITQITQLGGSLRSFSWGIIQIIQLGGLLISDSGAKAFSSQG